MKRFLSIIFCTILLASVCGCRLLPELNNSSTTSPDSSDKPPVSAGSANSFDLLPDGGNGVLNIHFVDVGQGDCIIIEFPDGKTMIIDAGNDYTKVETKIADFTEAIGVESFDYMLLTHADADHVGSMDYVFENYAVKHVFRPNVLSTHASAESLNDGINVGFTNSAGGKESSSKAYYNFLFGLQNEQDCTDEVFDKDSDFYGTYVNDTVELTYKFDFLTPVLDGESAKYKNANDYSPIALLTYNGTSILFTGDAEEEMEEEFVNYYRGNYPDCDLIKIGHHGSESSSSLAFLNAVRPEYAVIQCGVNKTYKHPRQLILDRLNSLNVKFYRTDKNGDVSVSIPSEANYKLSLSNFYCVNTDVSENMIGGDSV